MKISNESIQAIKDAVSIIDVISEYTELSRHGKHRVGFCPFDGNRQVVPLFLVNVEAQLYKCFSCGASGDPVKFMMDVSGVSYEAALRKLAARYQVDIIEDNQPTL